MALKKWINDEEFVAWLKGMGYIVNCDGKDIHVCLPGNYIYMWEAFHRVDPPKRKK